MSLSLPIFKRSFQLGFSNFRMPNWLSSNTMETENTIQYQTNTDNITPNMLTGFFVGWPNPPEPRTHLRILRGSSHIVLALNPNRSKVIGFITAISDGVSAAYIPHLEVLPEFQGRGIGRELVNRMIEQLNGIYMIDLMCDEDVMPFYERLGMKKAGGMVVRNYQNQSGLPVGQNEPHW